MAAWASTTKSKVYATEITRMGYYWTHFHPHPLANWDLLLNCCRLHFWWKKFLHQFHVIKEFALKTQYFRTWLRGHDCVRQTIGLDSLRGLFQPKWFHDSSFCGVSVLCLPDYQRIGYRGPGDDSGGWWAVSVRKGQDSPTLGTASSSQLQSTHRRAQLRPEAMMVASMGNIFKEQQNIVWQRVGGRETTEKQPCRHQGLRGEEEVEKMLQVLSRASPVAVEEKTTAEQIFPSCPERHYGRADFHTVAYRGRHTREGRYLLKDCSLWKRPMLE